jgi:hypothetical protein
MKEEMHPFEVTLRAMRRTLEDAALGLGMLQALAVKHGIFKTTNYNEQQAAELRADCRQTLGMLTEEGHMVLVQLLLLAGDPVAAKLLGVELNRPADEPSH